jgi:hypothetical protein
MSLTKRERSALATGLNKFKLNDAHVFDTTPIDLHLSALEQANAICIVLGIAVGSDEDTAVRAIHIDRALDAISTLIGLAALTSDVGTGETA